MKNRFGIIMLAIGIIVMSCVGCGRTNIVMNMMSDNLDNGEFQASRPPLKIVYPVDGIYFIKSKCAPDKALAVEGGNIQKSANVCIASAQSGGDTYQMWRFTRLGDSEYYKVEIEDSSLALNVHNGIAENGTNVTIWPYRGKMHQYRFIDTGDGYYMIQANIGGLFVLDVENNTHSSEPNVSIHHANERDTQKWKIISVNAHL